MCTIDILFLYKEWCLLCDIIFLADYIEARQKLKWAEEFSDINSCTDEEREEILKKSRKFRAAKAHESSAYEYSEDDEDDDYDKAILSNLPKPPIGKLTDVYGVIKKNTSQAYKGKILGYIWMKTFVFYD